MKQLLFLLLAAFLGATVATLAHASAGTTFDAGGLV